MIETSSDRAEQTGAQHDAMDRVRELLERDRVGREAAVAQRPWWPRIVGLLLAAVVVGLFTLGLDAFLAVYQRMTDRPTRRGCRPETSFSSSTVARSAMHRSCPSQSRRPHPARTWT